MDKEGSRVRHIAELVRLLVESDQRRWLPKTVMVMKVSESGTLWHTAGVK